MMMMKRSHILSCCGGPQKNFDDVDDDVDHNDDEYDDNVINNDDDNQDNDVDEAITYSLLLRRPSKELSHLV